VGVWVCGGLVLLSTVGFIGVCVCVCVLGGGLVLLGTDWRLRSQVFPRCDFKFSG
jgi:hypothetical protein